IQLYSPKSVLTIIPLLLRIKILPMFWKLLVSTLWQKKLRKVQQLYPTSLVLEQSGIWLLKESDYAIENGWWKEERRSEFDFSEAFLNFERPLQLSHIRVQRVNQLLKEGLDKYQGRIGLPWSRRIMRDHYEDTFLEGPYINAALPDFLTICMHHSPAEFTWGNTASSSQFILPKEEDRFPTMWWLAGVPCTGVYIP